MNDYDYTTPSESREVVRVQRVITYEAPKMWMNETIERAIHGEYEIDGGKNGTMKITEVSCEEIDTSPGKPVNIGRTDTYPGHSIPEADIETCLKVLRTLRNQALGPIDFDAEASIILSSAHAKIFDLCLLYNHQLKETRDEQRDKYEPTDGRTTV